MNGYFITGIAAGLLGIAIGAGGAYTYENRALLAEQAAHAKDNEQHADDLNTISKAALDAENRAIDANATAGKQLAALDTQLTKEQQDHETDNAKNRAAIADGTRRLRVAVSNFQSAGGGEAVAASGAGGVGNGASGTAELPPAFGVALFGIVDDADSDARAKADYLQGYVCTLQQQGLVSGDCAKN
ncbi:prophage endopeptidase [Paraburkholderia sp. EB58]|uniref:lysis system i-spanin subunit Rz n=1 Tax=Paraburkholderia sp. EB58 TaxID=3035125 RepID=UPI003D19FA5C